MASDRPVPSASQRSLLGKELSRNRFSRNATISKDEGRRVGSIDQSEAVVDRSTLSLRHIVLTVCATSWSCESGQRHKVVFIIIFS